jgi:hypothetical protein
MASTAATQVRVTAVEDNLEERRAIENKLQAAKMFTCHVYSKYRGENVFEAAQHSDIVSLDLMVQGTSADSIKLANELIRKNPHQSLLFFTTNPQEQVTLKAGHVVTLPGNFILSKHDEVWEAYDQLLLSIWIHDRCLAIIRATNDYYQNLDDSKSRETLEHVVHQVRGFYPALLFLVDEVNAAPAKKRYLKLRNTLYTVLEEVVETGNVRKSLRNVRRPLMNIVTEELRDIKNIDGVFTTTKLDNEIALLRKAIYGEKLVKTKVLFYESLASSLELFNKILKTRKLMPVRESSESWSVAPGQSKGKQPEPEEPEAANLYLNAWFPEYAGKDKLVVGTKTAFLVNLGTTLEPDHLGVSDPVSEAEIALFDTVEYLDVMVISPTADIVPLRNRLKMPPTPDNPARFEITPRGEGILDLTVILTVLNEPIHRTVFTCEVEKTGSPHGAEPREGF